MIERNSPERLIRLAEVMHLTGLSRSTIYERMNINDFPNSLRLGGRSIAWRESAIRDWINDRIASSENK